MVLARTYLPAHTVMDLKPLIDVADGWDVMAIVSQRATAPTENITLPAGIETWTDDLSKSCCA